MDSKSSTVYITNLADTDEEFLHRLFVTFGPISQIVPDSKREAAHIVFANADDANAAIDNAHHSEVLGRVITVRKATKEVE